MALNRWVISCTRQLWCNLGVPSSRRVVSFSNSWKEVWWFLVWLIKNSHPGDRFLNWGNVNFCSTCPSWIFDFGLMIWCSMCPSWSMRIFLQVNLFLQIDLGMHYFLYLNKCHSWLSGSALINSSGWRNNHYSWFLMRFSSHNCYTS
ncbi:hypothetical protein V8G54_013586 [Vigna mungo]|uniref:Uncharacterized protein n=1 Tax=Vigna mungo TaxID=3915 RepID=A0AAQ3NTM9_VIGMU